MANYSQSMLQQLMTQQQAPQLSPVAAGVSSGIRRLGGLFGADTRTPQEKQAAALQEQVKSIDLSTPEGLMATARLYQGLGDMASASQFAQMAQQAEASIAKKEAFNQSKNQLAEIATNMKLPDLAKQIRLAPDAETLKPIREQLTIEQINRAPATASTNKARLRNAGLNPEDYEVNSLTRDDVTSIIDGTVDADVEAWVDEGGKIVSVTVSSSGKVKTNATGDKWVLPYEAGLVRPAPQMSTVLNQSEKFVEALGDESVKDLVDLRDKAEAAQNKLAIIDRQLIRIGGMPTGLAANVELGLRRVAEFFGLGYDPKVTNAQEFMMEVANLVKTEIKAFGSGTSITDADREYTQNMVGGDITSQAQALENMLNIYRRAAVESINNYNTVRGKTAKSYGEENMGTFVPMDVPPSDEFDGFSIGEQ